MKNIKNIIAKGLVYAGMGAVLSTAFSSCRFEDDDYFSESAALRVEHNGEQLVNKLTAAPNGWVIQYFCANDVSTFEGFNLFATFEKNGKVKVKTDADAVIERYTDYEYVRKLISELCGQISYEGPIRPEAWHFQHNPCFYI